MTVQAEQRTRVLAEEPMRPAGPVKGFTAGTVETVRDLWAHRELLDLLIRRELKARYKDSTLGFFWSLMRPLTMLLIYYVAVGQFLGAARDVKGFAIYIFAGLTAWNLFNELVASGTQSIVSNSGLVKKVYLPREIFPLSTAGSALFNFAIQLAILVAAILVTGAAPSAQNALYFPLAFAVLLVFGLALALVLSAVNVYLRDVQYLIEIALMVLFWASPIVYSWTAVRDAVGSVVTEIYLANPMTLVVLGFQRAFWAEGADTPVPSDLSLRLCIALAVGSLLLWVAQRVFTRLQGNFAQEL
ncbi:MAG: ABC transporter permease [Cellulomonadaceae bacterium]|nr:ABC transporter permease [Cellulomonadaceae bacterium]